MATPTKRPPAGSGSTPSHLNQSSPAPRSVPSPVTARQPAGKTPVNHPTTGSTGSKTHGSTPMVPNLSQTGNTSSPSANMLSFNTPSGLGIDGVTPAGLSIPTPAMGGASMVPTMSDLGLTASGGKRNEDEERRTKVRKVLKSTGSPKGRVSEENIARISRRVGFQNDIDVEKLTPEEKERKVGNRKISTAGNVVVIDFELKNNAPQSVHISVTGESEALKDHNKLANRVLLDSLKAPNGVPLDAKLDRFALNLEHLARMDRLSLGGINCFVAVSGIYTSLLRLWEQEIFTARELSTGGMPENAEKVDLQVTCKKSGKPLMNADGVLGLVIRYWREGQTDVTKDAAPISTGGVEEHGKHEDEDGKPEECDGACTLRIEVEGCSAAIYPPLRVSDKWLPEPHRLLDSDTGKEIPWHEPPPIVLVPSTSTGAVDVNAEQKLPDVRFVAHLDPPVVMPYQTAMEVLSRVGAPTPQPLTAPPSYAALLLNSPANTTSGTFTKTAEQDVLSQSADGTETNVKYRYTLTSAKPSYADYGFQIDMLPFSHPRQLIEILPMLRQWARIGLFLKATFGSSESSSPADNDSNTGAADSDTARPTLDDLLSATAAPDGPVSVDITLATSPTPTLGVTFPTLEDDDQIGSVNVQILHNGDIVTTNHEGIMLDDDDTMRAAEQGQRLAKVLDASGDLGVWIEWMRTRKSGS